MAQIKFADLGSIQQLVKEMLDRFPLKGHTHTKSEITDYVVDNSIDENSENPVQNKVVHAALEERVPIGRTVNGKSLDADISLTATDVGADVSGAAAEALTNSMTYTDAEVDKLGAMVAYIDENDNETITLSVDLDRLSYLVGGDV